MSKSTNTTHKLWLLSTAVIILLAGVLGLNYLGFFKSYFSRFFAEPIHIAFVGGLSGEDKAEGESALHGVQLYIDRLNQQGGINGHHVVLDVFDDLDDEAIAKEKALEIAEQNRVLGVIGHVYSSASINAGTIYKQQGIPAITPISTAVEVTADNEWYFRTVSNDDLQGLYVANYIKEVLHQNTASIIYTENAYGSRLADVFAKHAQDIGLKIAYQWALPVKAEKLEKQLPQLITELKTKTDAGLLFLASHAPEGIKIVKAIKDARLENMLMTPDTFASEEFKQGFNVYPQERFNPGYYSNDIYVSAPLIFDTANDKVQWFRKAYLAKYQTEPDWQVAFAYDAAMVLIEAIKRADIQEQETLTTSRRKIRDTLADINSMETAVKGATGMNYFDSKGDVQKPIYVGIYKNKNLITALMQFNLVHKKNDFLHTQKSPQLNEMMEINEQFVTKTNVVYTGVVINKISQPDFDKRTYTLNFDLWFRFQGNLEPQNIEFLNALEPIELGKPIGNPSPYGGVNYRLYKVEGRFKSLSPEQDSFKQTRFGISFIHRNLNSEHLIYATDVLGMKSSKIWLEHIKEKHVLSDIYGWIIKDAYLFQDRLLKSMQGQPQHLNIAGGDQSYSQFAAGVLLEKDELFLNTLLPYKRAIFLLIASTVILFLLILLDPVFQKAPHSLWFAKMLMVFLMLFSGEIVLLEKLRSQLTPYHYEMFLTTVEILWWIVPAIFLNLAIKRFTWRRLEEKTEQKIPNLVQGFFSFLVYMLAFSGIVGFVFNMPITSILATSSVLLMIIGLAIQINLSNIFSGLAINLERPFKVGNWVEIYFREIGVTRGTVYDVNWRTTRLKRDGNIISLPNHLVSEAKIINYDYPDNVYKRGFIVHVDPVHPPEKVIQILTQAVNSVEKIEESLVGFRGISDWAADYWVEFVVKKYKLRHYYNEMVWRQIWLKLNEAGIPPIIQRHEIRMLDDNAN